MNAEEYKFLISEKDVLDYTTVNMTLKELVSRQEFELAARIKGILEANQIAKPKLHARPYDTSTTFYKIDLASDDIEKIIDIFFQLEVSYVSKEGETTPLASFYASLVDKWNKLA